MQPQANDEPQRGGYGAGHPWYYVLGGEVLSPKAIMAEALRRGYRGYLASEIDRADAQAEPRRSQLLRAMKVKALIDYRSDLSRYREVARTLHHYRREATQNDEPRCDGIHQSVSLKHNHLFNHLAHLTVLDTLLTRQRDLFEV